MFFVLVFINYVEGSLGYRDHEGLPVLFVRFLESQFRDTALADAGHRLTNRSLCVDIDRLVEPSHFISIYSLS